MQTYYKDLILQPPQLARFDQLHPCHSRHLPGFLVRGKKEFHLCLGIEAGLQPRIER